MAISEISLDGGRLCLDFINSVSSRMKDVRMEYLMTMPDLIAWARRLEIIDARTECILSEKSVKHSKEAITFLKQALEFREILYKIFQAIAKKKKVHPEYLRSYNVQLKNYFPAIELKQVSGGFSESWLLEEDSYKRIIAPILNDSYELLLSDKLLKVKECPSCGWLFYDSTKNGKRRWCSMKNCGSNVKALDWYHRQKLPVL
ncbi:MAG: CGNR zinc finger domain-containing protein [Sphingobacteriales bacterium]|nr:CGNR zinc finger domain-containing protein [Sphingobacteriales bacterium]